MIDLYVYYKVREEDSARLGPLVRAMQARLRESHGVAVQLKRRPQAVDGRQTWMEVYPAVADGFQRVLAQAELEAGLAGFIEGPRRSEVFTDLTACA